MKLAQQLTHPDPEGGAGVVVSSVVDMDQSTSFMKEVQVYSDLLDGPEYSIIGGMYDGEGREVLVESEQQKVCCVLCGDFWTFVLKAIKTRKTPTC